MTIQRIPPDVRFWRHVEKRGDNECWPWKGAGKPYGRFRIGPAGTPMVGPHKFSLEMTGVTVSAGMCVMHSCDNPLCVNPKHLSVGSSRDNTKDAMRKGRMRFTFGPGYDPRRGRGPRKLDDEKARTIKTSSESNSVLAERYGVDISLISRIKSGKAWRNV